MLEERIAKLNGASKAAPNKEVIKYPKFSRYLELAALQFIK